MRQAGIQGAKRRGKPWRTTIADPAAARAPDVVCRDFSADRPDALRVADFTYLRCWEGLVFFSFVIDVYSRRVVGWQFASNMRTDLVLDALRMALTRRAHGADVELIHHSDAGSQYTSFAFNQVLDDYGVLASIGSVGDAYRVLVYDDVFTCGLTLREVALKLRAARAVEGSGSCWRAGQTRPGSESASGCRRSVAGAPVGACSITLSPSRSRS
jgi:hypothetical protein